MKNVLGKRQKKSDGFTLVELLAVIVILAIILIIAVPGVLSIISKTKDQAYDRQIDMIKEATRTYVTSESNSIKWVTRGSAQTTVVTLSELKDQGYLDKKIIDPRDKSEILCANINVSKNQKNQLTYTIDTDSCKPTPDQCFMIDDSGKITNYNSFPYDECGFQVVIPNKINGISVTTIGYMAFEDKALESVILPEGLQAIENNAFYQNYLTNLVIPSSVMAIGDMAFSGNQIQSVTIKGKTSLSEFTSLGVIWADGAPVVFEP